MPSTLLQKVWPRFQARMMCLRTLFLGQLVAEMGRGCRIYGWPRIHHPEKITLGNAVTINHGVLIDARGGVRVGNNVRISAYAIIETGYLVYDQDVKVHGQKGIVIEDDAWLACRSTILPGVTIGKGAVVAAGAVVTKDVPPYHIAKGVPAVSSPIPERK